jgi:hypothetical protein
MCYVFVILLYLILYYSILFNLSGTFEKVLAYGRPGVNFLCCLLRLMIDKLMKCKQLNITTQNLKL